MKTRILSVWIVWAIVGACGVANAQESFEAPRPRLVQPESEPSKTTPNGFLPNPKSIPNTKGPANQATPNGNGPVYQTVPNGNGTLYQMVPNGNGNGPIYQMVPNGNGNIYQMVPNGNGTVYQTVPNGVVPIYPIPPNGVSPGNPVVPNGVLVTPQLAGNGVLANHPVAGNGDCADGSCLPGSAHGSWFQCLKNWLCYKPLPAACVCGCACNNSYYPSLYLYFRPPPAVPGAPYYGNSHNINANHNPGNPSNQNCYLGLAQ